MEYRSFLQGGLKLSRLCFGALTLGPLQKGLSYKAGGALIDAALSGGVNCIDTAEYYETYGHILEGIRSHRDAVVITRSYAYDAPWAMESVGRAMNALKRNHIDVMMLHEQESIHTLRGHKEALDTYLRLKEKGIIKAVGVSTHFVGCADAVAKMPQVDVLCVPINYKGYGIMDGSVEDMLSVIKTAKANGKIVTAMKPLGGGHLSQTAKQALDFVTNIKELDSIPLGMQTLAEVECNLSYFNGAPSAAAFTATAGEERRLHIAHWCLGCGKCVERCQQQALTIVDGKAQVNHEQCALCGYCAKACPEFAIKVY
ncbi:MAG: aldo/keto reductase [Clostridiales bacterium]|nr:aldo/keto reductase [Clostridiales bacterium]